MYIRGFESFTPKMLIVSIVLLLLAVTSSMEANYNFLTDYVKFNRIVLIIFILGAYIAYNALDVYAIGSGIGIYDGVFKITVLSQVFDIILFLTGAIVSILTCFVPYNYKVYNDSKVMDLIAEDHSKMEQGMFNTNFRNYYYDKLLSYNNHNSFYKKSTFYGICIKTLKRITEAFPDFKMTWSYLVENRFNYSRLEVKEYTFLLLFTVLGGSLLISSQNLISLYLSLELQSFTLYILSASQIRSFKGTSGGLKYFLLGGLSSGFILLGCSLLYAYTGTLNMEHIFMMYSNETVNYFIDPCLLILFAGLLFKVSAAPFHNWAPDVYSDVPTYSTTWLIVIAKLSIFIFMLLIIHNIYTGLNLNSLEIMQEYSYYDVNINDNILGNNNGEINNINPEYINSIFSLFNNYKVSLSFWNPTYSSLGLWTNLLTLSALLSLIIGTVVGVSQSRIKRLFAYSTITHVGFLLLALSLNSIASIDAFIFYLIQYTITNLNLFFILVAWGYLYSRYYLGSEYIPIRFLKINPISLKEIYLEPTIYDYGNYIKEKMQEKNVNNEHYYPVKDIKSSTIYNNNIDEDTDYYDFDTEDSDWMYTPVPYLTNLKGMHSTDPYLAFCLAVTIFSLAGKIMEC